MAGVGYPVKASRKRVRHSAPDDFLPIATIKSWLRVAHDDDDALLGTLRSSAISQVEATIGQYIAASTITSTYCPAANDQTLGFTELPVQSISSVTDDGSVITDAVTLRQTGPFYRLDPPTAGWSLAELVVVHVAGLDLDTHPDADRVREAALLLIAGAYENREAESDRSIASNPAVSRLLAGLTIPRGYDASFRDNA